MRLPDRETQNEYILATAGRLFMGEWAQLMENIRCFYETGTFVSDPAVRIGKQHLAPNYAGRPEGQDFAPSIEDALERGQSFDREDPLFKAYLLGRVIEDAEPHTQEKMKITTDYNKSDAVAALYTQRSPESIFSGIEKSHRHNDDLGKGFTASA